MQIDGRQVGLIGDRVLDIVSVDADQIQPVPRTAQGATTDFLSGLVSIDNTMIALIDLPNLLSAEIDSAMPAISTQPHICHAITIGFSPHANRWICMNLRIRLSHKIAAIGAIGVLGLAIVGGLYLFGSWTQARSQKNAEDASAIAMLTSKLSNQMLQARRAEKDFLLRRDDRYAKNHGEDVKIVAVIHGRYYAAADSAQPGRTGPEIDRRARGLRYLREAF